MQQEYESGEQISQTSNTKTNVNIQQSQNRASKEYMAKCVRQKSEFSNQNTINILSNQHREKPDRLRSDNKRDGSTLEEVDPSDAARKKANYVPESLGSKSPSVNSPILSLGTDNKPGTRKQHAPSDKKQHSYFDPMEY